MKCQYPGCGNEATHQEIVSAEYRDQIMVWEITWLCDIGIQEQLRIDLEPRPDPRGRQGAAPPWS